MRTPAILLSLPLIVACSGPSSPPPPPNTSRATNEPPAAQQDPPPTAPHYPPPPVADTPPPPVAEPAPPADNPSVSWTLSVIPSTFAMSQRSRVRIRVVATNDGTTTVDPGRGPLEIRVNGQSSMEANLAFGNGGRAARWSALPAGESVDDSRVGLGIFPRPGDYDLVLHLPAGDVARARVHVTADGQQPASDS